jgi:hypothetical protein
MPSKGGHCLHPFEKLQAYRKQPKLGVADVALALDGVNQGKATIHSMIFEPATLRAHIALGAGPATRQPRKKLECATLFKLALFISYVDLSHGSIRFGRHVVLVRRIIAKPRRSR